MASIAFSRQMRTLTVRAQRPAGVRPCTLRQHRLPSHVPRAAATEVDADSKAAPVEDEFDDGPEVAPSTEQVTSFLATLCGETEIAEVALEMGTFKLKVRRNVGASAAAVPPPPAPPPMPATIIAKAPPALEYAGVEESMDESLVFVTAPKVGIFRRGKYAAGKRVGKGNIADEGSAVKKGQAIGFIEQLGTFVPVEAPQAGEVVAYKVKEGEAVEYTQVVVELAPYFGGHIIGDKKYA